MFRCAWLVGVVASIGVSSATATVHNLGPTDNWYAYVAGSALQPGDEVVLAAGTYTYPYNINISHRGTAANPITIRADDGAHVIFTHDINHNIIQLVGAQHLILRGLELTGGSVGIRIYKSASHAAKYITVEDCYIHDTDNSGITANHSGNIYEGLIFRRNHLHNLSGYGEAFYLGTDYNASTFHDGLIEGNYIHDLVDPNDPKYIKYDGDGIEIKGGSYGNIVRDNVIHDVNGPGVIVYHSGGNPRNIIERNVIWNSNDNGIQAAADAIIRNNIVINSTATNIYHRDHQDAIVGNLDVLHNTAISMTGGVCFRVTMPTGGVLSGPVVVANNAAFTTGIDFRIESPDVVLAGNVESTDLAADFVDAPSLNVFPTATSDVLNAGDPAYAALDDFNTTARNGRVDAGAYHYDQDGNPGWPVGPGFKWLAHFGDIDHDGDADLDDAELFVVEMTGPGGTVADADCDADSDGDCDLADWAQFAANISDASGV